ncbi:hypothetical protein RclHR1_00490043 [Rhizophagus clarus]|uniref:Uncharacterized protein n=1 Tax=Rhizophagus clarus TaxID=94130 RepID=A0A2Z6SD02_9GLOM|nr:hypothetical protein RclHR1_00490043 [Rhizophagus clarus]
MLTNVLEEAEYINIYLQYYFEVQNAKLVLDSIRSLKFHFEAGWSISKIQILFENKSSNLFNLSWTLFKGPELHFEVWNSFRGGLYDISKVWKFFRGNYLRLSRGLLVEFEVIGFPDAYWTNFKD